MTDISPIEGPMAWHGSRIDYRDEGVHVLSASEIDEIDAALAHLRRQGELDFPQITPHSFPLPTLSSYLKGVGDDLHTGRGFLLLRGLPQDRWALDDKGQARIEGVKDGNVEISFPDYHGDEWSKA